MDAGVRMKITIPNDLATGQRKGGNQGGAGKPKPKMKGKGGQGGGGGGGAQGARPGARGGNKLGVAKVNPRLFGSFCFRTASAAIWVTAVQRMAPFVLKLQLEKGRIMISIYIPLQRRSDPFSSLPNRPERSRSVVAAAAVAGRCRRYGAQGREATAETTAAAAAAVTRRGGGRRAATGRGWRSRWRRWTPSSRRSGDKVVPHSSLSPRAVGRGREEFDFEVGIGTSNLSLYNFEMTVAQD